MSEFDIKKIRRELNVPQEKLAEMLGVHPRTVQNWEAGAAIPKAKHTILRNLTSDNCYSVDAEQSNNTMVLNRLKQYIDFKGITVTTFERSVGMSDASFGKSLKNQGAIGTDKLERILRVYPDISAEWLLTGEGTMLRDHTEKNINIFMRKIERFDKYMKYRGLNDNKVTVQLGLTVGVLGKSRKEGRDLSNKVIEQILNFYTDLNRVWLLTGEGTMLRDGCSEEMSVQSADAGHYAHHTSAEQAEAQSDLINFLKTTIANQQHSIDLLVGVIKDLHIRMNDERRTHDADRQTLMRLLATVKIDYNSITRC